MTPTRRLITASASVLLALSLTPESLATCGGGGGGGLGGATAGGSAPEQTYHVPWKVVGPGAPAPAGDLVLWWFPTSAAETRGSELLTSRPLTVASGNCVGMGIVTLENTALRTKYSVIGATAAIVISGPDGAEAKRLDGVGGSIDVGAVEKMLAGEMDARRDAAKSLLDSAKEKESAKDSEGAAGLYQQVYDQRCLLPAEGRKAARALKKLGRPVEETAWLADPPAGVPEEPTLTEPVNGQMIALMTDGLRAETEDRLLDARRFYRAAHELDPADPVPLRFLGELYRHHTGEWDLARQTFDRILAMRADPISRAVALHGLGKMTIHAGEFAKGLALFERSLDAYPLALTYRNLAVYWNSENQGERAYGHVKRAMELDPDDDYNQIFAATYFVMLGRSDEAASIAKTHEGMLAASYNLAAIQALLGHRDEALRLLRRHFYAYEQFDLVRAREMKEAREDIVFVTLRDDPEFIALTALADTLPKGPAMGGRAPAPRSR